MSEARSLLASKLHVPGRRRELVPRARLRERLDRGAESKLTLVSAPAGFGKTTLLAEWLAAWVADAPAGERAAAWLSLDGGDSEPASFWAYVVAALRRAAPGVGGSALSLLRGSEPPPGETLLTPLLNELSAITSDVVLVLDDYHVIDAANAGDIQAGMALLVERLPPRVHLVIASRADPDLPLARLRVRGELVELRAADLRFTPDEAASYLNGAMGLALTVGDVAALEGRTEGWIAALQLAALSMRGQEDVAGFIAGFAGDDRYIVDYLVEEVLRRQPEHVRSFLLQTSILDRLSGPLCDAVTEREGGKGTLETLDRENLFVVPLDNRRRWYRYHHLFADVLRAHLADERSDDVADLHMRAGEWHERNGERSDAIRHALAAGAFARAADWVELAAPAMHQSSRDATLLGWLKALPEGVVRTRPVLSVTYAHALLACGEGGTEGVEARLRDAERWLDGTGMGATADTCEEPGAPPPEMVVVDDAELRRLPGAIAVARAGHALALGDVAGTVTHARRALDLTADDDHVGRGAAAALLGLASWTSGDLEPAHEAFETGMAHLLRAGYVSSTLGGSLALADIRIAQGRLGEAIRTYERALQRAAEHGSLAMRGTADMHVGMSEICRERNDLGGAERHLLISQEQGEHTGLPQYPYRWRVAMARLRWVQDDLDGALALIDEAERVYVGDFSPNVRPVAVWKARMWIAQGRVDEALAWTRERGLSGEDELGYLRELEHVTLARVLLARYERDGEERSLVESVGLLERLLRAAEGGERTGSVIEILVMQALAHQLSADIPAALAPLKRALTLAEREGYVRTFADEGPPMAALLEQAKRRGISPAYVRRLLTAIGPVEARGSTPLKQALVDPLSERELEVLRLLGTDLGGPEIARELVVSLNTVRTHTKNIYGKLGASTRREAVRRAEELALL